LEQSSDFKKQAKVPVRRDTEIFSHWTLDIIWQLHPCILGFYKVLRKYAGFLFSKMNKLWNC